jgi:hypothetical protein
LVALAAGLVQGFLALCLLFLPIFAMCMGQPDGALSCSRETYIQMGGNLIGSVFLLLMIGVGVGAILSSRLENPSHVCLYRWLAVVISAAFVVVGAWSIGLLFLPGGLLMLLAARSCRHARQHSG